MNTLAEEAYSLLDGKMPYEFDLRYSGRFSDYNAQVKKNNNTVVFSISNKWKGISDEIVIGLLQHLFIRLLRMKNKTTLNIELYDVFIKSLHKTTVNPVADEQLKQSFLRVNEQFFYEQLLLPHMRWGKRSVRRLATYNHHTDTITVSSALQDVRQELLDFVVYHELLHKKLQYTSSSKRVRHHTSQFKHLEQQFPDAKKLEKELQHL